MNGSGSRSAAMDVRTVFMSKELKRLEALIDEQREHLKTCEAAVKAAQEAIWETQAKLRNLEKEKLRAARLTPAMVSVLCDLSSEGSYLAVGENRGGGKYARVKTPDAIIGRKIPMSVCNGLLERGVVTLAKKGGWREASQYVISDHGRSKIADVQVIKES